MHAEDTKIRFFSWRFGVVGLFSLHSYYFYYRKVDKTQSDNIKLNQVSAKIMLNVNEGLLGASTQHMLKKIVKKHSSKNMLKAYHLPRDEHSKASIKKKHTTGEKQLNSK